MEPNLTSIAKDIANAVAELINKLNSKKNAEEIVTRSALQVGIHDFVKFAYKNGEIQLYTSDNGYSGPDLKYKSTEVSALPTNENDIEILTPLIHQELEKIILPYDQLPILDHTFKAEGRIINGKTELKIPAYIHTSEFKRQQLLQNIDRYLEQKIDNGKYPTKELDTFFLSRHMIDDRLFNPLNHTRIIQVFDKIAALNSTDTENLKEHRHHINYALRCWVEEEFLPQYYDITKEKWSTAVYTLRQPHTLPNEGLLELVIYAAIQTIWFGANYQRSTGVEFLEFASTLGSRKAAEMLKSGTGEFQGLNTPEVIIHPNDVAATVSIELLKESEQAYSTAINQLISLLQHGFPRSYSIQLLSKENNYLPIAALPETDTHRFFANALQYKGLQELLATYAREAMSVPDEWYGDAEDEFCCLPGTYAVFGLGLTDATYFPLVQEYMKQVDTEHQSVQYPFTQAFIEKYGASADTIPTIVACLLACQNEQPLKQLAGMMRSDALSVLLEILAEQEPYEVENILQLIWGSLEELQTAAAEKDAPPQLQELLQLAEEK